MSNLITPLSDAKSFDGPVIRLLHCLVCDTMEELPPFEGRPENDHLLAISVERHQFPSGEPHKGNLFVLPVKTWMDKANREEIIRQIKGGGSKGLAEFDASYYDTRSTFMEDAMTCWKEHLSKEECDEYESSGKRLVSNSTKAERKDLGLPDISSVPGPKIYLCHFCPVHVGVQRRKQKLLGM